MLYTYLMTYDCGYAPNPFHGVLTLATCKPGMRRVRQPGQWIAGFAGKTLHHMATKEGTTVPVGGMIYLAKITDVKTLDKYFDDPDFASKKPQGPIDVPPSHLGAVGDNMYHKNSQGEWLQEPGWHDPEDLDHDVGGENAVICKEFYYLGRRAMIPEEGWSRFGIVIPHGRPTLYGYQCNDFTERNLQDLRVWLESNGIAQNQVSGMPCLADFSNNSKEADQCTSRCG